MYVWEMSGRREMEMSKALSFYENRDAIKYVKKHGYQKITTTRKIKTAY